MISEKMQQKLDEQIQKEFFSAYLYLSMEAHLASQNLDGMAHYFRVQTQEERDHAMMFFNFVHHVGGKVTLKQIDAPQATFTSLEELFTLTLEHERLVTKSIYELVDLAIEERDHKTNAFLQWFVTEQAEEENNAESNLTKIKLVGENMNGVFMLDAEMAKRIYTPPANSVG